MKNFIENIKLNTERALPFSLQLSNHADAVLCHEIKRVIRGKRLVIFGTWGNKEIVAKLFFARGKAKQHATQDAAGIAKLVTAGIPTPPLLYQDHSDDQRLYILIFERILDAYSLPSLSDQPGALTNAADQLHRITLEIATQHVLGIVQRDLHLNNFLFSGEQIYSLDGRDIDKYDTPLGYNASLKHLSLLFSQLGVGAEQLQLDLFATYRRARGWLDKPADVALLFTYTELHLKKRAKRYLKKIHRDSSDFVKRQHPRTLSMIDKHYQSSAFADESFLMNPEKDLSNKTIRSLKQGNSATVLEINLNNQHLILKRYNIKNTWHAIRRVFRRTRAKSAWHLGHYLRFMGIATAKPIAFIEKRSFCFHHASYLLMEPISGLHAGDYFIKHAHDEAQCKQTAHKIIRLVVNLANLRLTHGDLKMTNILIQEHNPVLIDLDGMQYHHTQFSLTRSLKKEVQRLLKNWETQPTTYQVFKEVLHSQNVFI